MLFALMHSRRDEPLSLNTCSLYLLDSVSADESIAWILSQGLSSSLLFIDSTLDAKSQSAFTIQSILFSVAGIVSGDMAKRRVYGPQPPQPFRQSTATTEGKFKSDLAKHASFKLLSLVTTAENMARGTMAWDVERLRLECRRRMRSLLGKNWFHWLEMLDASIFFCLLSFPA